MEGDEEEDGGNEEPDEDAIGADFFGDEEEGEEKDLFGKDDEDEDEKPRKKSGKKRGREVSRKDEDREDDQERRPARGRKGKRQKVVDPFEALADDADLSPEGKRMARSVREIQSRSDTNISRLEGQIQALTQALQTRNGNEDPNKTSDDPPEELNPLQKAEARFQANGQELPESYRGAATLVTDQISYELKKMGLDKLPELVQQLQQGFGGMQQTLNGQQSSGFSSEAAELREAYEDADIRQALPVLAKWRGIPHPATQQPMTLLEAMDFISGNAGAEADELEEDHDDIILSSKKSFRGGHSPGGRSGRRNEESGGDVLSKLSDLFG